jgi:hypothetical protein
MVNRGHLLIKRVVYVHTTGIKTDENERRAVIGAVRGEYWVWNPVLSGGSWDSTGT